MHLTSQFLFGLLMLSLIACSGKDTSEHNSSTLAASVNAGIASSAVTNVIASESSVSPSENSNNLSTPEDTNCPSGKRILGYFPSWQGDVADIQYQYLTHILYAFALPNSDGSLKPMAPESDAKLRALVERAQPQGVKVGIAIGGWNEGDDSAFVGLASNPDTRALFVSAVVSFVETYRLDGVDMDWEYPSTLEQANNYTLLMGELSAALDKLDGSKFLSAAVIAQGETNGQYIQNAVFDHVDFLNIMAYDENNADHSSLEYAATSLAYWKGRGLTPDKILLGVPFYARPSWATYSSYVAQNSENACRDSVEGNYYNGIPGIRTKSALARSESCGVMMWELSQDTGDDSSLLRAIWEVLHSQPPTRQCD